MLTTTYSGFGLKFGQKTDEKMTFFDPGKRAKI